MTVPWTQGCAGEWMTLGAAVAQGDGRARGALSRRVRAEGVDALIARCGGGWHHQATVDRGASTGDDPR